MELNNSPNPRNTLLNNEENNENRNNSWNSNNSEMSVDEVGLEYLKNLYNKKCHDIGISENKLEDILSKIFEIKRGGVRDFTLKFNECSLMIFILQFLKDHFHDVNYIKHGWYGNNFKQFINNMFDINHDLRDRLLNFMYLSTNLNLKGEELLTFTNSKEGYIFNKIILYNTKNRSLYTNVDKKTLLEELNNCGIYTPEKKIILKKGKGKEKEIIFKDSSSFLNEELCLFMDYIIESKKNKINLGDLSTINYLKELLNNCTTIKSYGFIFNRIFKSSNEDSKDLQSTLDYIKNIGGNKYLHSIPFHIGQEIDQEKVDDFKSAKETPTFFLDQENKKLLPQLISIFPTQAWSIGSEDKGQHFIFQGPGSQNKKNKDICELVEIYNQEIYGNSSSINSNTNSSSLNSYDPGYTHTLDMTDCTIRIVFKEDMTGTEENIFNVSWEWSKNGVKLHLELINFGNKFKNEIRIKSKAEVERNNTLVSSLEKHFGDFLPMFYDNLICKNRFLMTGDVKSQDIGLSLYSLIRNDIIEVFESGKLINDSIYTKIIREKSKGSKSIKNCEILCDEKHYKLCKLFSKIFTFKSKTAFKKQSVSRKKRLNNEDDKLQSINIITQLILYKLKSQKTDRINKRDLYNLIESIITDIYNSIKDSKKHIDLQKYKKELEILFPILTPRTIQKALLYVLSLTNDEERHFLINHILSIYSHNKKHKSRKRRLIRNNNTSSSNSSVKKISKKKKKVKSSSSSYNIVEN